MAALDHLQEKHLRHDECAAQIDIDHPVEILDTVVRERVVGADAHRVDDDIGVAELSGVQGVKQSAGDLKMMADLMLGTPSGCKIYTAVDALLYPSFALGCHGTIAANPAAVPGVRIALWNAVQRGDHVRAREIHEALLRFWNTISSDNLPANIKTSIALQGTEAGLPRMPMPKTSAAQLENIKRELANVLRYEEA